MDNLTKAIIIVLIIYIIYTVRPNYFPRGLRTHPLFCQLNRFNNKIIEKFTGISIQDIQLESFYKGIGTYDNIIGLHYTDWCPHCREMKPIWFNVKELINKNGKIYMFENNEETNPTPGISGFPTIIKYSNGSLTRYNGEKNVNELLSFVNP